MKKHSEYVKKWRYLNPEKLKAHTAVNNAVRKGLITKEPCLHCGNKKGEAHHNDYSDKLNVIWLCRKCHSMMHTNPDRKIINNKVKYYYKKPVKSVIKDGKKRSSKSMFLTHETFIKELRTNGFSYNNIAKQLNISKSQAFKVCNNPNYK